MSEVNKGRRTARENVSKNPGRGPRPPEDQAEIRPVIEHLLIAGASDTEIARQTGVDRKAVSHLRKTSARPAEKDHFGHVQHGPEDDRVQAEILRLRAEGLTYVQIAEEVGLSWNSVRARLRMAYKSYMETQRDHVAGRQHADIEMMRNELLEVIIRDYREDMEAVLNEDEQWDELDSSGFRNVLQRAYERGRKNQDSKFKAMEVLIRLMDREAKLFGLDAADQLNVNVSHTIKPEAIGLLTELKARQAQINDVVEAEIVDDFTLGEI